MGVERRHEELVAEHAESVIDQSAAGGQPWRQLAPITPDLFAGARVQCPRHVLWAGHVQNVVADKRCRLEVAECRRLERPLWLKPRNVLRRNLRERAEPMVGIVAAKRQPA